MENIKSTLQIRMKYYKDSYVSYLFKIFLILVLTLSGVQAAEAQREKNNIYLFDCTGSMNSNKLWEPAQQALEATIENQESIPGSHFVLIPFGTNPAESISFESFEKIKKEIKKTLDENNKGVNRNHTNISAALESAFQKVNSNKDNNIYLLTDGEPEGGDTSDKVAETIQRWCLNHKNTRLFYVALRHTVNPVIARAIDNCKDAYIVEVSNNAIPLFVDIDPSELYTNIEELGKPLVVNFNLPGTHPVKVISDDSKFNVKVNNGESRNGKITLIVSPKDKNDLSLLHQDLYGRDYKLQVKLESGSTSVRIVNPNLTINISDEIPIKLTIGSGEEELAADGVKWYDSFWWSEAKPFEKIDWDLKPVFENEMKDSSLKLKFRVPEGEKEDFQAWYNGEEIKPGDEITIEHGKPSILTVQFNSDARTGKRYFSLVPVGSSSLDMVNGEPIGNYEGTSLRTEYSVGWNPLKTFMVWLGIIIVALLVLWLIVLKPLFYPSIKVGKIEFTGPGSYYRSKKIKGARKAVFTSERKKQNILSRIFTGKVIYERADHFKPALEILPASGKKKIKIRSMGGPQEKWEIHPSGILARFDKGTIINSQTKDKSEIEIS